MGQHLILKEKKKITTFIHKAQIYTKYTNKYIMNTDIKIL